MKYFPINLNIRNNPVVVVGGGSVAERKCRSLLDAGALITVIAPDLCPTLQELVVAGVVKHVSRRYQQGDLAGALLVFAATNDPGTNIDVAVEARKQLIPVNVADSPEAGTFTSPAVVARGDLLLTVSTGGKSPAMAMKICDALEASFGEEYAEALQLLGAVREKLLTEKRSNPYNKILLDTLISYDLPKLFSNKSFNEIDRLLQDLLGTDFTLDKMGVEVKEEV